MAKFYADVQGQILQFLATRQQEQNPPAPAPVQAAYTLQFDELTNNGLISSYQSNPQQFAMPGNTLVQTIGGVTTPVTVNPPNVFYEAYQNALAVIAKANDPNRSPWTAQEIAQIAAVSFRIAFNV